VVGRQAAWAVVAGNRLIRLAHVKKSESAVFLMRVRKANRGGSLETRVFGA